jgi:AcrR family transcriptional regulator
MDGIELNTELKILEAAKKVFTLKGMGGARMQEIADEAGINKALLHYYYRSKDKLFEAVFKDAFLKMVPNIVNLLTQDMPLFDKIELFVDKYIDLFLENPFIPGFVIQELSQNPQRIVKLISGTGIQPQAFIKQIDEEIKKGRIKPLNPQHLIVNLLALCIFPFVAAPILKGLIFGQDDKIYAEFIQQRKTEIPQFIINSIKNE